MKRVCADGRSCSPWGPGLQLKLAANQAEARRSVLSTRRLSGRETQLLWVQQVPCRLRAPQTQSTASAGERAPVESGVIFYFGLKQSQESRAGQSGS